jgi:zinc transporter, ZIP family
LITTWVLAGVWGLVAASALVVGALLGWWVRFSTKTIAYVMAFGSGILISALSFELVAEAMTQASIVWTAGGFMAGALVFSIINRALNAPVKHRKGSRNQTKSTANNGLAIAAGTLLDGIPESMAIGLLVATGGSPGIATIAAIFISNIPEALSSTAGMRHAGHKAWFLVKLWGGILLLSGAFAVLGAVFFGSAPTEVKALISCIAAGGIFAMVVETMIPEAFAEAHELSGLIAALGFITALGLQLLDV